MCIFYSILCQKIPLNVPHWAFKFKLTAFLVRGLDVVAIANEGADSFP